MEVSIIAEPAQPQPGINGAADPRICEQGGKDYLGIGILHGWGTMLVLSAPAEYPAYRAGVRVGDFITDLYRIPKTDYMVLEGLRHTTRIKFKIKMERICFKQ